MSTEHETRSRVFYDREDDEPRGRRRRPAADWGVEVDVFDRMPSRRFSRRGEEPRPAPVSRTIVIERDPEPRSSRMRRNEEPPSGRLLRDEEPRVGRALDEEPRAARIVVSDHEANGVRALVEEYRGWVEDDEAHAAEPEPPRLAEAERPGGRRTVVIGGHPDRLPLARTRPPRTAVERLGPRPDRIVAYSVALGVLLILIAILTSH